MLILAIESSCDEFSVSVMENGIIKSNIISSQIKDHIIHGGVVPELASRLHTKNFPFVLIDAINESGIKIEDVDYIAYTNNPGLIGSLIIGRLVANTIGYYYKIPTIPLNHMEGHIYSANIEEKFTYPVLSLVVSGGHTQIQFIKKPLKFDIIGSTIDDAIGECFDKVARVLGLPYPGGPEIDKRAKLGRDDAYIFPKMKIIDKFNYSFSGLKTASINLIRKAMSNNSLEINDFCASFQKSAIDYLLEGFENAINYFKPKTISLAGGVSANNFLRNRIFSIGTKYNIFKILVPNLKYCTDNAAMIAELCNEYIKKEFKT
ncbi:tRNA (adenosine(37)-N6)-threonylcarbamoyltransferase complex transferase subunit TsaD [Spiroplasma turonicum]|uniref:tRNA N6-adenosine threonylcarbamoyltransferase n=1 Tax=Spiroplasma turonicum TaxID=216946 RepID=A0A0K1P587_9MOLU|nr:tRNA (adenosine(37)-N6)-threonylcarbamoyltransferase complex transferase subunit TsaD [Spiroplasma turonicum]AKU79329.1 DNA-binding/iron metalloprotein/AP endonuclease [Spiroplasma turonicum]ALX70350.1 DNA-binding/iron metalloprotein/AP endonuclease [Spiroplasma turonicum]